MITLGTGLYIFAGIFVSALVYMAITKQEFNLGEADIEEQGFNPMSVEKKKELKAKGLIK